MQAVRSVVSGGKFYRLPPDKENTAFTQNQTKEIQKPIKVTSSLQKAHTIFASMFFIECISIAEAEVSCLPQIIPQHMNKYYSD